MARLPLTRMSLLRERAAVATAARGVEILHHKRDALLRELHHTAREALAFRQQVGELGSRATVALVRALGDAGRAVLRSTAAVGRRDLRADVEVRNLWGVRIPHITSKPAERRAADRGAGRLATSVAIDEAAETHERLLTFVLQHAPKEIRLRRLAAELGRTSRKVNTLEHDVIPTKRENVRRIAMALEEQEREDRYRLEMLTDDQASVPRSSFMVPSSSFGGNPSQEPGTRNREPGTWNRELGTRSPHLGSSRQRRR